MTAKTKRQKWLSLLVYPALEAWTFEQRRRCQPVQGYAHSTFEGRYRAQGDAALISGQGLKLEDQSEDVTRVDEFLEFCASEVERELIREKWLRERSDEEAARRCGYSNVRTCQIELGRVYERLHGYLFGRHT